MSAKNQSTADTIPSAGPGRWWRVERRLHRTQPIVVKLNEITVGNRRAMSAIIGIEYTIANPEQVAEAARLILARVADYELVIGEYGDGL